MEVSNLPKEWIETLKDIQFIFPTAVIAGGCLRDFLYDKEVKDIDIFIQTEDAAPSVRGLELALGVELRPLSQTTETEEYQQFAAETDRNLIEIYSFVRYGIEHQIIFLKPDPEMVNKFDLSFCQITTDGKEVFMSELYFATVNTREVTLGKGRELNARIIGRIIRFSKKYPELTFPEIPTDMWDL